jgi:hypothetical protein
MTNDEVQSTEPASRSLLALLALFALFALPALFSFHCTVFSAILTSRQVCSSHRAKKTS